MKNVKRISLLLATTISTLAPIATTISCNSEKDADLYIFSGKNENLAELKKAGAKFSQLYKNATGKEIKVKIAGAGNGADVDTIIKSFLQKKKGSPDVVTSFGIGDVKQYVDSKVFEEIKADDPDLAWAKNNNSIASNDIAKLLQEELTLKNDTTGNPHQWGLPINYESVGIVVNVKTLGEFFKKHKADPMLKIADKAISAIGVDFTKPDNEIGQAILKYIYKNGWSKNELNKVVTLFNADNAGNGAFALAASPKDTTWISGFHAVPNWLSTREGSADLQTSWKAYRNSFDTLYPKDITGKGGVFKNNSTKTPLDVISENSNGVLNKNQVEDIIADYYKTLYGQKLWKHGSIQSYDSAKVFPAFGDGSALFTHASTGMYPWIIKTIGADKIGMNDIAPIPMPLNTNNGADNYKDIPVDFGMLWHIINKKDNVKSKLAKKFLEWISTGKTTVKKDGKNVEINDSTGTQLFYNSDNSKLVNPFKSSTITGGDITSEIVKKEIKGQDWGDNSSTTTTDNVTLWTNGGLGQFSKMGGFAEKILKDAGKPGYTGKVSSDVWNTWKSRLNSNEL